MTNHNFIHLILINYNLRGEIVEIPALIKALDSGKLWGCALDVFEGEKKYIFHNKSKKGFRDHPDLGLLAQMNNVILSSHIAFYTDQAVRGADHHQDSGKLQSIHW